MKRWLGAWLCVWLAPAVTLAQTATESTTEAPEAASSSEPVSGEASSATPAPKKGEKKDAEQTQTAAGTATPAQATPAAGTVQPEAAAQPATATAEAPTPESAPEQPAEETVPPEPPTAQAEAPAPVPTTTAAPTVAAAAVQTPEQLAAMTGWNVSVGLGTSVGAGTFLALGTEHASYFSSVDTRLSVSPRYSFRGPGGISLQASASLSGTYELTPPDNAAGRRFSWSDLGFGLSAPQLYKEKVTGIAVSPSVSLRLPTSLSSLWAGHLATVGARVGVNRMVGKFNLSYALSGSRGFHASSTVGPRAPSVDEAVRSDPSGRPFYICRAGQELCAEGGINTAWSLSNGVGVTWFASDTIFAWASTGISHSWRYALAPLGEDELTSQYARTGLVAMDTISGSLGAGYSINSNLSVGFDMGYGGPLRNGDNKSIRFPFFDFSSRWGNGTSFSLSLSAQY